MGKLFQPLWAFFKLPCLFQMVTGLYCPGCGGTRSAVYLLHGDLVQSFVYHPLVPYMVFAALLLFGSWLFGKVTKKPECYLGHELMFTYIGVGIILVNWIVKNVCLIGFGIDLLAVPLS